MAHGAVGPGHPVAEFVAGGGHSERTQQRLRRELLPCLAGAGGDRLRTGGQPVVGVGVGDPERIERQLPQLLEHIAAVVAEVLELVAGVVGQPRPVGEHVADGDHLCHRGVGEREPGQLRHDRRVPVEIVLADLLSHHRGAQRLRHRRDLEHRVGVDPVVPLVRQLVVLDPETFGVQSFSVVHHGDRHPGDAGLRHQILSHAVEGAHRVGDGVLRQRHRRHQRRWHRGRGRSRGLTRWSRLGCRRGRRGITGVRGGAAAQQRHRHCERDEARRGSHGRNGSASPRPTSATTDRIPNRGRPGHLGWAPRCGPVRPGRR